MDIDLRLGEATADRCADGRLDLTGYRCRVGHVRHRRPSWSSGMKATCAPGGPQGAGFRELGVGDRHLQAASPGSPALTPLQIWSLVAYQPLAITSPSLSAVIGVGWRMIDFTVFPPGVVKSAGELPAFGATDGSTLTAILLKSGLLHSESAAWPAALPSSLLFFQISTYCL